MNIHCQSKPTDTDVQACPPLQKLMLQVVAATKNQEQLQHELLRSMQEVAEHQKTLTRAVTTLSNEVLDLRQGLTPGSNHERIALILSGAAAGGGLVTFLLYVMTTQLPTFLPFISH